MVWPCIFVKESSAFLISALTRYDVDGCLNIVPIRNSCHVHSVDHLTRVGCYAFFCCWSLHRTDESQLARNSCPRLRFSVWSLSCRCRVKFSTHYQPCRNMSHLYFWLIRSFTDPVYTCSIFVCGPLLIVGLSVYASRPGHLLCTSRICISTRPKRAS